MGNTIQSRGGDVGGAIRTDDLDDPRERQRVFESVPSWRTGRTNRIGLAMTRWKNCIHDFLEEGLGT